MAKVLSISCYLIRGLLLDYWSEIVDGENFFMCNLLRNFENSEKLQIL